MRIREQLSYSNVVATIALVAALGTGGAYAAGQIGSGEIRDNSIRSVDLKNRGAVTARDRAAVSGRDIRRNTITGAEVRERTLDAGEFAPLASDGPFSCDPTTAAFINCAAAAIDLPRPGRLLAIADGGYYSEGGPARINCRIAIDGVNEGAGVSPGESATDNTSAIETDGFAHTLVSGRLARGRHHVALRCAEPSATGDGRIRGATIAVIGIAGAEGFPP